MRALPPSFGQKPATSLRKLLASRPQPLVALALLLALLLWGAIAEPVHADALSNARALAAQGNAAAALQRVDQAMAADPRDVQLRFMRGVMLMDLKRDAEALAHFQQMNLEFPELPDPLNNMALLQVRAGRLDDARTSLETALRYDPAHRTALANLGQVYLMLAARALQNLAAHGPMEPQQQRQLQGVRALLLQAASRREPG